MSSVNKVILVGNLGKNPETRYMTNGDAVTNITLATTESWKDKAGVKQEKTEWHRITFYRKLAEIAGRYLKKGASAYIEGKLTTRKWSDKQGIERYTTEIIADELKMLGSKPGLDNEQESKPAAREKHPMEDLENDLPWKNDKSLESDDIPF